MKIAIGYEKESGNIITIKEYTPIDSKGEVSHFLAELEIIKNDLLEIWEEINNNEWDQN